MSEAKFEHHDLRLVEPSFGSPLTDLIIELEHLREKSGLVVPRIHGSSFS